MPPELCLVDERAELQALRSRALLGIVLLLTGRAAEALQELKPTLIRLDKLATIAMGEALRELWLLDRKRGRQWVANERFAVRRGREGFEQLRTEVGL